MKLTLMATERLRTFQALEERGELSRTAISAMTFSRSAPSRRLKSMVLNLLPDAYKVGLTGLRTCMTRFVHRVLPQIPIRLMRQDTEKWNTGDCSTPIDHFQRRKRIYEPQPCTSVRDVTAPIAAFSSHLDQSSPSSDDRRFQRP